MPAVQQMPVIDASATIPVIHQDHDYSHLPNGQPHYRLARIVREPAFSWWSADGIHPDGC